MTVLKIRVCFLPIIIIVVMFLASCSAPAEKQVDATQPPSKMPSVSVPEATEVPNSDEQVTGVTSPTPTYSDVEVIPTEIPEPVQEASAEPAVTVEASDLTDDQTTEVTEITNSLEFSFLVADTRLTLCEHNIDTKLEMLPLELISDETRVLGNGSDTFTGSLLRTVLYDGFEIILFAPEDDKENFWIMQMTAVSSGVTAHRGIRVGDTVETLLSKYPEAEELEEDGTSVYFYTENEDAYNVLSFSVDEGIVSATSLTFYLP